MHKKNQVHLILILVQQISWKIQRKNNLMDELSTLQDFSSSFLRVTIQRVLVKFLSLPVIFRLKRFSMLSLFEPSFDKFFLRIFGHRDFWCHMPTEAANAVANATAAATAAATATTGAYFCERARAAHHARRHRLAAAAAAAIIVQAAATLAAATAAAAS